MGKEPSASEVLVARELAYYERIKAYLLTEGHARKWILIKGDEVMGLWPSYDEARAALRERFPGQVLLLKQIVEKESVLKCGYNKLCRS